MRVKDWLIHKLGGYTASEVFSKAWQVAQTIHVRDIQAKPGTDDRDELDEDMRDCCGCQYWDGDDGICHHPAHIGQETQNGCVHKDGGQDDDRA